MNGTWILTPPKTPERSAIGKNRISVIRASLFRSTLSWPWPPSPTNGPRCCPRRRWRSSKTAGAAAAAMDHRHRARMELSPMRCRGTQQWRSSCSFCFLGSRRPTLRQSSSRRFDGFSAIEIPNQVGPIPGRSGQHWVIILRSHRYAPSASSWTWAARELPPSARSKPQSAKPTKRCWTSAKTLSGTATGYRLIIR